MPDMNRRDFVHFLAVLCAGAAAMPQQLEVFEKYYEANTPLIGTDFVAVDEIWMSGNAIGSLPVICEFYKNDHCVLPTGLNLFGGIFRWQAAPDQKIVMGKADFFWDIRHAQIDPETGKPAVFNFDNINGQISFIDTTLKRNYLRIKAPRGSLADQETA